MTDRRLAAAVASGLALALVACVPSVREVEAPVRSTLRTRVGADLTADPAVRRAALAAPLTRASVRRLALAGPRAAEAMATLGVAAGEAAAMRALGGTSVDVSTYLGSSGGLVAADVDVIHDLLDLVLLAPRRAAGGAHLDAARARAAAAVLAIVAAADDAFLTAAAAVESAETARTVFDAAAAGAELVERIHAAGGTTDLALARAQALREEARLAAARADAAVEVSREELDAVLGLGGDDTRWSLGEGLPELPSAAPALDDLETTVVATSLELAALRGDARAAANRARAAGVKAWLPELGAGVSAEYFDGAWFGGPAVRVGIPIGSGERGHAAAARADVRRVAARTRAIALELRARARATRLRALAAYGEARHLRDVLLPLRRRVLDETVLQYNAMNATPLDILTARRELAVVELALVDARHRFAAAMNAVETLRRGAAVSSSVSSPVSSVSSGAWSGATGATTTLPAPGAGGGGH